VLGEEPDRFMLRLKSRQNLFISMKIELKPLEEADKGMHILLS